MKIFLPFLSACLLFTVIPHREAAVNIKDIPDPDTIPERTPNPVKTDRNVHWLYDKPGIPVAINSRLKYRVKHPVLCDSAVAIDYIGFSGGTIFFPVNNEGRWLSSIKNRKKLSRDQQSRVDSLIADKRTYKSPINGGCFEPRLAVMYFSKGKVTGQTTICLQCGRMQSTMKLGDRDFYSSFNESAREQFETICEELDFSYCMYTKK